MGTHHIHDCEQCGQRDACDDADCLAPRYLGHRQRSSVGEGWNAGHLACLTIGDVAEPDRDLRGLGGGRATSRTARLEY
jgi:hypothetical protein